jgi:hypothetical protein
MERPVALAWIAVGWHHIGKGERRDEAFRQAISTATTNPNSRMRNVAALEVCLAHDSADLPLQSEMASELRTLASIE